jgi:hypothetical protein
VSSVGVDFCKFLRANSSIAAKVGQRVYHRHVPEGSAFPFIYLYRQSFRHERCLGESGDPAFSHTYAVEVVSDDDTEADDVATLVRALDGSSGTFGGRTIQGLFVEEQNDDYEPKAIGSDEGYHIPALSVEVVP